MAPVVWVALYVRKSDEVEVKNSVESQVDSGKKFCKDRGWKVREIFIDEETAWAKPASERDEFVRMIEQACLPNPPFSKILVWKIDRFARRLQDSSYLDVLQHKDIELVSQQQTFGEGANRTLQLGLHLLLAQYFSDNLSEDIKRGVRALALQGFWGGGTTPYGYRTQVVENDRKKLIIHEEEAVVIREIFESTAKGHSIKRLLHEHPEMSRQRLHRILHNELYCGNRVIKRRGVEEFRAENTHPQIVSKQLFDRTARALKSRRKKTHTAGSCGASLFGGIVRCKCGRPMVLSMNKNRLDRYGKRHGHNYYRCISRNDNQHCGRGTVREDVLWGQIVGLLEDQLFSESAIAEMFDLAEKKRRDSEIKKTEGALNRRLTEAKVKRQRLIEAVQSGLFEEAEVRKEMESLREEMAEVEDKLTCIPSDPISPINLEKYLSVLQRDLRSNGDQRREALRDLVQGVVVDLPRVEVTTHMMGMEEVHEIEYYPQPEVPDNYTQLGRGECLRILAQIRNWMQDRSCRGATKNWTLPQIREYIGNYVRVVKLQNASLSLEDDTKSEE